MLYSTTIKLDKEYTVKLGIKEMLRINKLGINIIKGTTDMEEIITMLTYGLSRNKEFSDLDLEEAKKKVIDLLDESEISYDSIKEIIHIAIGLGVHKKTIDEIKKDKSKKEDKSKNV